MAPGLNDNSLEKIMIKVSALRNLFLLLMGLALLVATSGCASHSASSDASDAAAWKAKRTPPAGYLAMAKNAAAGPAATGKAAPAVTGKH